jgi:catechol 2,3-dioxygenase-like lactoylglutathione lyase family enzyme
VRRGTIAQVTSRPAAASHLRDLARLRRVRDRIDREYAQPLDVEALARGVNMSAGRRSRGHRRRTPHHRRDGNGTYASIMLATSDLDGTFERVQVAGAEVVQEPTDQPWGTRDCAFRDPAGNLVRIQELR